MIRRNPRNRQSCSTDSSNQRLKKGCRRRSSTCCGQPCLPNCNTLDRTGSTRVVWLISLCVIGSEFISRSSTLKIAFSSLSTDGKGSRDIASATAFGFEGTNLMLWSKADNMIAQRCRRMAEREGMAVLGAKIRSRGS